jgi:transketolase
MPTITDISTPFEIGKASWMFLATHPVVGIIATGPLVYYALLAAKKLHEEGIPVAVLNMATIKPIDEEAIVKLAVLTGAIVTVEEHQVTGGLGGAVAEVLAKHHPTPMRFVGVQDDFGQSGEPKELITKYKLDDAGIVAAVKEMISKSTHA